MSDLQRPDENVIFLHIPKTAGSTINFIIEKQYPPETIFTVEKDTLSTLDTFEALTKAQRTPYRVFKGHTEFGVHKMLIGPSHYFTFLRDPFERVISDYYFILRTPHNPHYQLMVDKKMTLKQTVESTDPLIMMRNTQTILVAGLWRANVAECTPEILALAQDNLRRYFTVGLTEKFDHSLLMLQKRFGWGDITYRKLNVTRNRPKKSALSPEEMQAIQRTNQYDIELYQFAQELFREQANEMSRFLSVQVKLFQLFNWANNFYFSQKARWQA